MGDDHATERPSGAPEAPEAASAVVDAQMSMRCVLCGHTRSEHAHTEAQWSPLARECLIAGCPCARFVEERPWQAPSLDLGQVFDRQLELQVSSFIGQPPWTLALDERIDYIHMMVTALQRESFELLDETSWKSWARDTFINRDDAAAEAADLLHFLVNICLALDCGAGELLARYYAKADRNVRRQAEGYEHGSDKCPTCGRALDEPHVETS